MGSRLSIVVPHAQLYAHYKGQEAYERALDALTGRNMFVDVDLLLASHLLERSLPHLEEPALAEATRLLRMIGGAAEKIARRGKQTPKVLEDLADTFRLASEGRLYAYASAVNFAATLAAARANPGVRSAVTLDEKRLRDLTRAVALDDTLGWSMEGDWRSQFFVHDCYEKAASRGDLNSIFQLALKLESQEERVGAVRRAADAGWAPAQDWLRATFAETDALLHVRYLCMATRNHFGDCPHKFRRAIVQFGKQFDPNNDVSVCVLCEFGRHLSCGGSWLVAYGKADPVGQYAELACQVYRRCCNCSRSVLTLLACVCFRALPLQKDVAQIIARLLWRERGDAAWELGQIFVREQSKNELAGNGV